MKLEVLFPEVCNLSGESTNVRYLLQSCPALEAVETELGSRPQFLDREIALVYLGTATERGLQLLVESLVPYREELLQRLDAGQWMLATGNALDALGKHVESDEGLRFDGLGILDIHAEYHMMRRHNSFFLGKFGAMDMVGFQSLFGHSFGGDEEEPLFRVTRGVGRREGCPVEGFRKKNLLATYLTGPLLVLNPPFTKWLLRSIGAPDALAFEEAAMDSYRKRVAEFSQEDRSFMY